MSIETDEQFLDRLEATPRYNPAYRTLDSDRLFALARRGAAAAARIEQLEAALAMFACDCTVSERCTVPDNCRNFKARRMLEKRT